MKTTSELRPLLLDTHIWLWLVLGTGGLSGAVRKAIRVAASNGDLRIAAMTLWEVALLAARNRVVLGKATGLWLAEAVAASAVEIEPLSPSVAVESCTLPGSFHADPADRMIVATARVVDAALMTRDRRILDYAESGHLTAIAA
jgi:PIN domain nuclease of toxin-antitoxin system